MTSSSLPGRALTEDAGRRTLPPEVASILGALQASPRLVAHLGAVQGVAWRLTGGLGRAVPGAVAGPVSRSSCPITG
ncbi:hypothetical protein [Lentzea atacamensis]|uniref:hypothetical protein n=1 Tax=Lentzea atacamensis TaxID=531938 RepID=UPI0011BD76AC|nr:hypothetical protein [Lentzea atacamensis]